MEKHRKNLQRRKKNKFKRCPMGGTCFNPLCAFGCVER